MEEPRRSPLERFRSDLRSVVAAAAYGYTLTVWSTGMVLSHAYGPPSPPEVLSFFIGAVVAFAVVGALAFGGMSGEFGDKPNRIQLWGSFHFLSVGVAWFSSGHVPSVPGWPLGAFVATVSYLVVVGAENAAADVGTGE